MRNMASRSITSSRHASLNRESLRRAVPDLHATFNAQAALTEIARAIVGRSTVAEVAQVVVSEVRRLVPSDRSSVWRWLPERDAIQILALGAGSNALGVTALGMTPGDIVPTDAVGFRSVLETGRPLREADLGRHAPRLERGLAADGQ